MDTDSAAVMLVTANVGSIFEDPHVLLKIWIQQFLKTVNDLKPKFLALHCQEIGGKNYEESMKYVGEFVTSLVDSEQLRDFTNIRIFLDEDFTNSEKFTALGSFYFIHKTLSGVQLWDFEDQQFSPVNGREIFSGNIESVSTKEKAKFPQDFFPECKWSRKGFIRTRWKVNESCFDLINIHLFHDASNFLSIESFPSTYTKSRQHALKYTLDKFADDAFEKYPFFIFGDFNFRLDTGAVIKKLTKNSSPLQIKSAKNGETEKLVYKDPYTNSSSLLTLGKKVFDFQNQQLFCEAENFKWLLEHDRELEDFREQIFEFKITFPPSYPFTESSDNSSYMKTRCPSWCDRVLLSKSAKNLVQDSWNENEKIKGSVIYEMIGRDIPMGDHKPVFLWFHLDMTSGNDSSIRNCNAQVICDNFGKESSDISTRYIYVQCGDSPVTVFRETTV